jgi:tight adherence protein B
MIGTLSALKYGALGFSTGAILFAVYGAAANPQSLPHRALRSYVAHLDRSLRDLFIKTQGRRIAVMQFSAMCVVAAAGASFRVPLWWAALPLIALLPVWRIGVLRKERIKLIEMRMDSFALTLANALRSTPSIGNALLYAQPVLMPPINQEVALALKEMRVGNTVDQALLNMSARIRSAQLDAALSGILIGRQVGGDLPKILETTANTLREMTRLQGVLQAKTAEGKLQVIALAVAPLCVLIAFDFVKPGYFAPITSSVIGWAIVTLAVILWLTALIVARQVLKVEL